MVATSSKDASSKLQFSRAAAAASARDRSTWAGLKSQPQTSTPSLAAATMQAESPLPLPSSAHTSGRLVSSGGWPLSTQAIENQAGLRSMVIGSM